MGKIKLLPPEEIHKIAAGEVVERPASVVKELVENAIDAGASSITIYVEQAGKALIRVVDNGHGMSSADACMSIVHHATSKITSLGDLEQVKTFGFRGEALSSIAAVSRLTLVTKETGMIEGTKLIIEDGRLVGQEICACPEGTDVSVADLFYNIPARRKFLRTDETELRALSYLVQAFALSYPQHALKFYHNQRLVLHCQPAATIAQRLPMIWDAPITESIIPCQSSDSGAQLSITGVLTTQEYVRYDRNNVFIFVNNRWVRNTKLTQAVLKGYSGMLPIGRYPVTAIFLEVDPRHVDINVHPRKEEVHFLHPRRIEQALEKAVREAFEAHTKGLVKPSQQPDQKTPLHIHKQPGISPSNDSFIMPRFSRDDAVLLPNKNESEAFSRVLSQAYPQTELSQSNVQSSQPTPVVVPSIPEKESFFVQATNVADRGYRLIGQLLSTYVLVENEKGLVLFDQHAVHERVLYELFSSRFDDVAIVPLLFPPLVKVAEAEAELLVKYQALFAQYGIVLERYGPTECIVRSIPIFLKDKPLVELIKDILGLIIEKAHGDEALFEKTFHHALRSQMACKAAVKAGDVLSSEYMYELLDQLSNCDNSFTCPHGRPTSWIISTYEIERKFKRK